MEDVEPTETDPTTPPVDADEEKQRLLADAAAHGINPGDAVALAEKLSHLAPPPVAYRAVDRRLATGHSLEETEAMVLGDPQEPDEGR